MTLLERWDQQQRVGQAFRPIAPEEIRRALAIAQAVEEKGSESIPGSAATFYLWIKSRADELLKDKP